MTLDNIPDEAVQEGAFGPPGYRVAYTCPHCRGTHEARVSDSDGLYLSNLVLTAAWPILAAQVRRETADRIADAISKEASDDEKDPDRQTDYWQGVAVGKRSAAALTRAVVGAS